MVGGGGVYRSVGKNLANLAQSPSMSIAVITDCSIKLK